LHALHFPDLPVAEGDSPMSFKWLTCALRCCGKPALFYSLLYAGLGLLFMLGSRVLDPVMATVGLILLLVGAGIFALFALIALWTAPKGDCDAYR
jgi:hypothetical protein